MTHMKTKIIKAIAGFYYCMDMETGDIYECRAKGIFRKENKKPLVGDLAEISVIDPEKLVGNVDSIYPRKNELIRPAVANVDRVLLIFAVAKPDPNLNLMDRYLCLMGSQNVPVTVAFNKCDIADEGRIDELKQIYDGSGCDIEFISVKNDINIDRIAHLIEGQQVVLSGPSGVGKSSLINRLVPGAGMETGFLSAKNDRGKQTTRHTAIVAVNEETSIIDSPGFSSLDLVDLRPEDVSLYFPEFEPYICDCRFPDCVHIGERECGVKNAVANGAVSASRYENYKLIYESIKNSMKH